MNTTVKPDTRTAVGGKSREELLKALAVKPSTFGWDALVVYNRGRANALLMQQYIQKLTAENYLQPIYDEIKVDDENKLHLFGAQLGVPRMSFETADINKPLARLTMAITAGMSILKSEPIGGFIGIHSISRPNGAAGPKLWLEIPLKAVQGSVNEAGTVSINLSEMEKFDTNLFSDKHSIDNAKEFFLALFKANPAYQTYILGILDSTADSDLRPEFFDIRTHAAPGGKTRGAANFGDGAVVLFVTLKEGKNGTFPATDADLEYMIPSDENGTKYSSAVLLSNKVLFNKLMLPVLNVNTAVQFELTTPTDSEGNPLHIYARAISGDFIYPKDMKFESSMNTGDDTHYSTLTSLEESTIRVTADGGFTGLRFQTLNDTFNIKWQAYSESKWNQEVKVEGGDDFGENGYFTLEMDTDIDMTVELDSSTGVIRFLMASGQGFSMGNFDWLEFFSFDSRFDLMALFTSTVDEDFYDKYLDLKLPDIDTFLLQNLLFPDQNSMVLTDAHVPGDLAVFGNVNPSLTSFVISPENPVLSAGASLKFTTDPVIQGVEWKCRVLPGDTSGITGSFSANGDGTYTAPSTVEMAGREAQQVIITATGNTQRTVAASSSALVSIVSNIISVDPLFKVVAPGNPIEFTAGTVDDRPLHWAMKDPGQNGDLVPTQDGREATYTAASPPEPAPKFVLEVIQVTDDQANIGQTNILVVSGVLGGQVKVDLTDAQSGKAQLQFIKEYNGVPTPIPHEALKWNLLAGMGGVNAEGLYTAPEQNEPGFALVTCRFEKAPDYPGGPTSSDYGYLVLPLPLGTYPDLDRAYN